MSLNYLNQIPIVNISLVFKSMQFTVLAMGLIKFVLLLVLLVFLDKKRIHGFLLGFFQSLIQSHVLLVNPEDSKSSKQLQDVTEDTDSNPSVKNEKRVDQILYRGDAEIVLASLGLISSPEDRRLDLESHEISNLFVGKNPSLDEVKAAYDVFDSNRDGFIDSKDLQKVLCSLGLDEGLEMDNCQRMIDVFDKNGDGRLDFEEFVEFLESSL